MNGYGLWYNETKLLKVVVSKNVIPIVQNLESIGASLDHYLYEQVELEKKLVNLFGISLKDKKVMCQMLPMLVQ